MPAVFDKEGLELLRFVRGDMYLADASHTKGHTHPVTGASWNPAEAAQVNVYRYNASLQIMILLARNLNPGKHIPS